MVNLGFVILGICVLMYACGGFVDFGLRLGVWVGIRQDSCENC